jgi:hypothetical protein
MATPKKKTDKKAPAKKAAAKKAPAKKVPAKKAPAKKAPAKKSAPNGPVPNKKAAPKKVAKVSQTSTTTSTVDADVVWNVFQNESADVSATVNGKVIYANDVKPESVKKKFLAWFKR